MTECMNGSTGTVRHDEYTEADYEVHTSESFTASNWCAGCVLEYIECGMGECIQDVTRIRPIVTTEDRNLHEQVVQKLPFSLASKQP